MNISLPFVLTLWHFILSMLFYVPFFSCCSICASMWCFISPLFFFRIIFFNVADDNVATKYNCELKRQTFFSVVQKYYLVHDQIFNTVFNYRLFWHQGGCETKVIESCYLLIQLNLIMLVNVATLCIWVKQRAEMWDTKCLGEFGGCFLLSLINVSTLLTTRLICSWKNTFCLVCLFKVKTLKFKTPRVLNTIRWSNVIKVCCQYYIFSFPFFIILAVDLLFFCRFVE